MYRNAGTATRRVSPIEPQTDLKSLGGEEAEPSPPTWPSSSATDMRSLSSSAASTATVGAGLGAFTRCCVYRASVTEEQCSSSSIESDTIATVDSFGIFKPSRNRCHLLARRCDEAREVFWWCTRQTREALTRFRASWPPVGGRSPARAGVGHTLDI